jgi:hypothetical protein
MTRREDNTGPLTAAGRLTEELLVRAGIGCGAALMALCLTPLLLGALSAWWFVGFAATGFVVGFLAGDLVPGRERARRKTRPPI